MNMDEFKDKFESMMIATDSFRGMGKSFMAFQMLSSLMKHCLGCGTSYEFGYNYCPICGDILKPQLYMVGSFERSRLAHQKIFLAAKRALEVKRQEG